MANEYSFQEYEQIWVRAGGARVLAPIMAAIGYAESRGNVRAHYVTAREDSRGLWQINVRAHPQFASQDLYDPLTNARAALGVLHSQGLGAWSTYTSGAYKQYMPGQSPSSTSTGGG